MTAAEAERFGMVPALSRPFDNSSPYSGETLFLTEWLLRRRAPALSRQRPWHRADRPEAASVR